MLTSAWRHSNSQKGRNHLFFSWLWGAASYTKGPRVDVPNPVGDRDSTSPVTPLWHCLLAFSALLLPGLVLATVWQGLVALCIWGDNRGCPLEPLMLLGRGCPAMRCATLPQSSPGNQAAPSLPTPF